MAAQRNHVKRNLLASWVAHGATIAVGFFLMPYVVKVLGTHQYGAWVFINSLAAYSGLLYFGFGETISRYVSTYSAEQKVHEINQISSLVFVVYSIMGCVAMSIAGGLAWFAPQLTSWEGAQLLEVRLVILVLGLNATIGMIGSVFGGILMGSRRFDLERAVSLASDIVRLVLIVGFLQREWGLLTIALIYCGITLAEQLTYVVMVFRIVPGLRIDPRLVNWSVLKECSQFSTMAFVNAIAAQLIYATDTIVIGRILGTDAIVPYYIGLRLTQFIRQPIEKISQISMPTAGSLSGEQDRRRLHRFVIKAFGVSALLATSAMLGAFYFGGHVIRVWMGEGFEASHQILIILLGAQLIALPMGVLRAALFGTGNVRTPAIIYFIEAIANLILSILFCQQFGTIGVAYGTLLPILIFEVGWLLPYACRKLGLAFSRLMIEGLAIQVIPACLIALYCMLLSGPAQHWQNWPALLLISGGGVGILGIAWIVRERLTRDRSPAPAGVEA